MTDSCPAASPRLWLNSSGEASHSELPVMYCTLTSSWLLAPALNLTMLPTEYPEVDTTRTFLSPALSDPDVSADVDTASPITPACLLWSLKLLCWPYNADGSSCTPMGSMAPSGAGVVVARVLPASMSAPSTIRAMAEVSRPKSGQSSPYVCLDRGNRNALRCTAVRRHVSSWADSASSGVNPDIHGRICWGGLRLLRVQTTGVRSPRRGEMTHAVGLLGHISGKG